MNKGYLALAAVVFMIGFTAGALLRSEVIRANLYTANEELHCEEFSSLATYLISTPLEFEAPEKRALYEEKKAACFGGYDLIEKVGLK